MPSNTLFWGNGEGVGMKKRLSLAFVAGALLSSLWVGSASAIPVGPPEGAAGPPIGTCPTGAGGKLTGGGYTTGWSLVQPSGPEHLSAQYDFNGDGWVCGRVTFTPAFGGSSFLAFLDNAVRHKN